MFSAWDGGVRREAARFCSCLRLNKELFVNALWNTGTKKWGKEEIQHLKKPLHVHSWHRNMKYLSGLFGTASPSLSNPWQNLSPQLPWYSSDCQKSSCWNGKSLTTNTLYGNLRDIQTNTVPQSQTCHSEKWPWSTVLMSGWGSEYRGGDHHCLVLNLYQFCI